MHKTNSFSKFLHLTGIFALLGSTAAEFGASKTPEQCKAESEESRADLLSGKTEPYAFKGAASDCKTPGCLHAYWGPRCRYQYEPSCPIEGRQELTGWLRYWSDRGGKWAEDILLIKPCQLWPHLINRVTWMVGDSMTQDAAHTIMCFMMEYMLPDAPTHDVRGPLPNHSPEIVREIEANTSNKRVAYWCRSFQNDTTLCYINADTGKRTANVVKFLPRLVSRDDIVVMNIGLHFNRMEELRETAEVISAAVKSQRSSLPKRFYWKETSPQHYLTSTGMLNMKRPVTKQLCHPAGEWQGVNVSMTVDGGLVVLPGANSQSSDFPEMHNLLTGGARNRITSPAMIRAGMKILPTYNITLPLWQYHHHIHPPGEGGLCGTIPCDCTHTCAPSWGQLFLGAFKELLAEDDAEGRAASHNPMERFSNHRTSERDAQGV